MEYGIIIAAVSLFGTFALVLADATSEVEPPVTAHEPSARGEDEMRRAA